MPEDKLFTTNALAGKFDTDRRTLLRWLKDVPPDGRGRDRNPLYKLSTVAAVVRERVAKRKATATAREKLTLAQVAKIETWIAIQRKAWLPVDDVAKFVGDLGSAIRKIVLTIHLLAPNVVGLSVADAEARLKEVEDDILQNLHLIDERIKAASNESEENSQPTGERILRGRQTEDEPTNQIR